MNQNNTGNTSTSNVNNNAVINIENNYTGSRNNDSSSNISRLGGNSNILNVLDNDSGAIT